jgi:hypothetical protein
MITVKIRENEKERIFTLNDGSTAGMLMIAGTVKVNPWDKVVIEGVGEVHVDYKLADGQVAVITRGEGPYTQISADSAEELVKLLNAAVMSSGVRPVAAFSMDDKAYCILVPVKFA